MLAVAGQKCNPRAYPVIAQGKATAAKFTGSTNVNPELHEETAGPSGWAEKIREAAPLPTRATVAAAKANQPFEPQRFQAKLMHREERPTPMSFADMEALGNRLEREKRFEGKPSCFHAEVLFSEANVFSIINTETGEVVETVDKEHFIRFSQSNFRDRLYVLSFRKEASTAYYFVKLLDKKDIDRLRNLLRSMCG